MRLVRLRLCRLQAGGNMIGCLHLPSNGKRYYLIQHCVCAQCVRCLLLLVIVGKRRCGFTSSWRPPGCGRACCADWPPTLGAGSAFASTFGGLLAAAPPAARYTCVIKARLRFDICTC